MTSLKINKAYWSLICVIPFVLGVISQIINIPHPPVYGQDEQILLGFAQGYKLSDFYRFFDPTWGWHYRPVLLFWLVGGDRLTHGNALILYWSNIVLHGLIAAAVALLGYRFTNRSLAGVMAAALFIWTSQLSQVPRWIAAANIMFVGIAFCAAIYTWKLALETGKAHWRFATLACVILALLSKEEALVLLPLLVYFDFQLAPTDALKLRFRRLIPVAVSTAIYLPLMLISHPYSRAFYLVKGKLAGGPGWRPPKEFNLLLTPKFILDALPQVLGKWSPLAMWVCFGLLSWRACRHKAGNVFLAAFLLTSVLVLAMIGSYADQNRFKYIPSVMVCILFGIGIVSGEKKLSGHLAVITALVIAMISPGLDGIVGASENPYPHYVALGLACASATILGFFKWMDWPTVLIVALCAIGGHIDNQVLMANPENPHIWGLLTVALAVLSASRSRTWDWWHGPIFAAIVLVDTESILPLTVFAWAAVSASMRYCERRSSREGTPMTVPQQV